MKKNDQAFVCAVCGAVVPKLGVSSRNHCNRCLSSLHVDIVPGDRQCGCLGIMRPVAARANPKKGYIIMHRCTRCNAEKQNKYAPDDDIDLIIELTTVCDAMTNDY